MERYLASQHFLDASRKALIPALWSEVVGQWYGRHTQVMRVWEGIVEVQCDSAARAQQLQLDSEEIIRRLNARLGEPYVRQIRPSTGVAVRSHARRGASGHEVYTSQAPSQAELDAIVLTATEEAWLAEQSACIRNEEARAAYQKALRTHMKLKHWKLDHGWQTCRRCGALYDPREGCLECR